MAWVYVEIIILKQLFNTESRGPDAFIVFYACGWILSGLLAIFIWLWNNKGREIIRVSDSELYRSREYVWFSRSKVYYSNQIRNLRVVEITPASIEMSGGMEFWGLTGGAIMFDYEAGVGKIGLGLDEAEAKQIIEVIKTRYNQF